MKLTRKQFLDIAGPGALGAAAYSAFGSPRRAEARETREGGAASGPGEKGFSFHASASALGGHFSRPFNEVIEAQASSTLTHVGGYDSARVEKFRYREVVSFEAAYTQVIGSEHGDYGGKVHETLSSAVVEGLDVQGMVTADRVVARLARMTCKRSADLPPTDQLRMLPLGSYFENLRIAGVPIELRLHPRVPECETKQDFERKPDKKSASERPFFGPDGGGIGSQGRLRLSIFDHSGLNDEKGQTRIAGATPNEGCRIEIPGFGTIYLGEYLVEEHARELTMIRLELGSPAAGSIVVCGVQGDGRPY